MSLILTQSQINIANAGLSKPSSKDQRRIIEKLCYERNIRYKLVLEIARDIAEDKEGKRIRDIANLTSSEARKLIKKLKVESYMMIQKESNHR